MGNTYNIKFKCIGFSLKNVTPRKMGKVLLDEYIELRNEFYQLFNPVLKERNEYWESSLQEGEEYSDYEKALYNQEISNYMSEIAFKVAMQHPDSYLFPGTYFGKGGVPKFLARIKQHPELCICDNEDD